MRPVKTAATLSLMAAMGTALSLVMPAPAALAQQGAWTKIKKVPSLGPGVEGMAVGVINGKIIAAFGFDPGSKLGDTKTTRIYDPASSSTWDFGSACYTRWRVSTPEEEQALAIRCRETPGAHYLLFDENKTTRQATCIFEVATSTAALDTRRSTVAISLPTTAPATAGGLTLIRLRRDLRLARSSSARCRSA